MVEFIKWCFSDGLSGLVTLCVMGAIGDWILKLIKLLRNKKSKNDKKNIY